MYERILVPHAGTSAGNKALQHAKKLAKLHNSKITILHVVEKIPTPPMMSFSYERKEWSKSLRDARNELKIEMREKIQKHAETLGLSKITTNVIVLEGYPEEHISRIANKNNFDLVVMAKRKKLPGIKAILKLGSVSRKVLEQVSCPVLLIDGKK